MTHADTYLKETAAICAEIDPDDIELMAQALSEVKGRVYMVGLGGSLANCMHMAADLRKLCEIDAVAPDNLAELTAWANDEGMDHIFDGYLSKLNAQDALFVLSVGGGTGYANTPSVSLCLTFCTSDAKSRGAKVFGIVGPHGGATAVIGDCVIKVPVSNPKHVTPHTEAFQAVIWHCLVSHPLLQKRRTKW